MKPLLRLSLTLMMLVGCVACQKCSSSKTGAPPAVEVENEPANVAVSQNSNSKSCACDCMSNEGDKSEVLCKGFTKEKSDKEPKFVCERDYFVKKPEGGTCDAKGMDASVAACKGYRISTKVGPVQGTLTSCKPG